MRRQTARPPRPRVTLRQVTLIACGGVLILALLALVVQVTVTGALRDRQPRMALSWSSLDAKARAQLASRMVTFNANAETRASIAGLSRDALRRDLLQPLALRSLALASATGADGGEQMARLMLEANRISRRDQVTQLWLIEYFRRQNDVPAMMQHFDIALRTSSTNLSTLFPLLAAISGDPRVAPLLTRLLRSKPHWALPFAAHLIDSRQDDEHVVRLVSPILRPSDPVERRLIQSLINRLVTSHRYDLAWETFRRANQGNQDLALLRNAGFESSDGFAPFDWVPAQGDNLWAAREQSSGRPDGHILRLVAENGGTGQAARQLLRLAPGQYRVAAQAGDIPSEPAQRPELRVACADPESENLLLSARPEVSGIGPSRFGGEFTVPANCRFQWLVVAIATRGGEQRITPWIDDLSLVARPAG